jgi:hypothetical protein
MLGQALAVHSAGEELEPEPNDMFRRGTDRFIHREVGKLPLDVGADRIARTAYAALKLLRTLRARLELQIPLAWASNFEDRVAAIEVYPAATLKSHGVATKGYKRATGNVERTMIVSALRRHLDIQCDVAGMTANVDALDAAVCVVAGKDFLDGNAMRPSDLVRARREGWIWCATRHGAAVRI